MPIAIAASNANTAPSHGPRRTSARPASTSTSASDV